MDRRGFLSWSVRAPLSAVGELLRGPRCREAAGEGPAAAPLSTGLPVLDEILDGGLPGVGVTLLLGRDTGCAEALLLNIVSRHLAPKAAPVAYVSAWHTRERIIDRLAYVRTGLDRFGKRRGRWTSKDQGTFEAGREEILRSRLHFEDARRLRSLADVARSLLLVKRARGLGLVVVDDAPWFVEAAGTQEPGAAAEAVGAGLRDAAESLGIPVIAFCPVSWDKCSDDTGNSMQPALGPSAPLLRHCVACLAIRFQDAATWGKDRVAVAVEFHPTASRGSVSFHCYDQRSSRITDRA